MKCLTNDLLYGMNCYVQPGAKPASDEIRNFYIAPPLTAFAAGVNRITSTAPQNSNACPRSGAVTLLKPSPSSRRWNVSIAGGSPCTRNTCCSRCRSTGRPRPAAPSGRHGRCSRRSSRRRRARRSSRQKCCTRCLAVLELAPQRVLGHEADQQDRVACVFDVVLEMVQDAPVFRHAAGADDDGRIGHVVELLAAPHVAHVLDFGIVEGACARSRRRGTSAPPRSTPRDACERRRWR